MVSSPEDSPTSHRPLARLPFYYGWVMVWLAAWAMSATLPGRTHGLGLITEPLVADPQLGIDALLFSRLNFWAVLIGAAACLPVGRLIDRFGVRAALVVVALLLGTSVLWMSHVTTVATLFVSLTLVRGFGQGALSVVSMALIGKWFTRRLGPAMGLFTVLLSIGFIAGTVSVGEAVPVYGWRTTWAAVGWVLIFGLALPGWLLARRSPESIGISPDVADAIEVFDPTQDVSVIGALKTPAFWIVTLATAFFNLVWSAITLFNESLLAERGFDHDTYVLVMAVLVFAGLPANLFAGWWATRRPMGPLLALGMLLLAGSLAWFPWISTSLEVIIYAAALGIAGGIITVIFFTYYGRAFGRTHLGTIQAVVQTITVFASASGPVVLTQAKEATGSNAMFFYFAAIIAALLGGLAWFARSDR